MAMHQKHLVAAVAVWTKILLFRFFRLSDEDQDYAIERDRWD